MQGRQVPRPETFLLNIVLRCCPLLQVSFILRTEVVFPIIATFKAQLSLECICYEAEIF